MYEYKVWYYDWAECRVFKLIRADNAEEAEDKFHELGINADIVDVEGNY